MAKKKADSASSVRAKLKELTKATGWSPSGLRGLLAPVKGRGKGGDFERDMSRAFSKWWTNGERDDIFWRTGGSGGRATARSRSGKHTAGQYGDIAATDPLGVPLIEWVTIELKRGYTEAHIGDVFDRLRVSKSSQLIEFFKQARNSHEHAGSDAWMVVHARDRRNPMVWMPGKALVQISLSDLGDVGSLMPQLRYDDGEGLRVVGFPLSVFFDQIDPQAIRERYHA